MDGRTLYALATLLLLVQLPHLLHLPLWVSLSGSALVACRLLLLKRPRMGILTVLLSPVSVTVLATASALLINLDYGYFIGRDPSVAFLFILVAAKFAEVRRPGDATLLLCLAAFLLLTQYFYSQSILAALVSLPAAVALAFALAILRDPANPARLVELLKLVGTLLLQGLPLAAILFLVFPRLPGPLWSMPEDAMASTGLSDSMSPGSIGELSQSDAVAFRVEFDGPIPDPSQRYWRGPVLSDFDGRTWTSSTMMLETNPGYAGPPENIVDYTVMLQPHNQRWLFALDAAVSLPRSGNPVSGEPPATIGHLMSDGQMIAREPISQVTLYHQSSVLLDAVSPARYPSADTLYLPGRNLRSLDFAAQLRDSVDSDVDYARAILAHFNQQAFFYTLRPQLLGDTPVDEFLFNTRAGFCEHYAAAFVVLMRGAGIPSRVVTGYLGGEMNDDYMIVRQSDAHAWAEAFIDGAWRRYDPTAAVAPTRVQQGLAAALPGESSVPGLARRHASWLRSVRLRFDAINHQWQRLVVDFDNDTQNEFWDRLGFGQPSLWQVTAIVVLLTGAWCALVLGLPSPTQSRLPTEERLWRRLCRLLSAHGLKRRHGQSANEYLCCAIECWPARTRRIEALRQNFEALRFRQLTASEKAVRLRAVKHDLRQLMWSLLPGALLNRLPRKVNQDHAENAG